MSDQERKAIVERIWGAAKKMDTVQRAYITGYAEGALMTTALMKEKGETDGRDTEEDREDRAELSGAGLNTV